MNKFLKLSKVSLIALLSLIFISVTGVQKTQSYYGGMYGGMMGGMMGMYGGMYGGMMGMYGGMYGGMMGMYGGMSGLSSMYSPFGLQNMYYTVDTGSGLSYQVPFLQIAPLLGVAGLYSSMFPSLFGSGLSGYGRAAQQVISALYNALVADPLLGPVLLTDTVSLNLLASDAALAAVVAANPLWLAFHSWQVLAPTIIPSQPLLLSKMAVTCTQCHSNVNSGALLAIVPLPTQLI